ncbi:RING finger protein 165-like [Sarcoptes scabiei]|nr:RING finger protein 165-like [Sarcoptes scabiei]
MNSIGYHRLIGLKANFHSIPLGRFLTRIVQILFVTILIITIIINILFIIRTRNRLNDQSIVKDEIDESDENDSTNQMIGRWIKIEIVSSQNRAMVTIDGTNILDDFEEGKNRGIHILVLNEITGFVMSRRHFDTYMMHEDEAMSLFISMVSDGRILIFTIKDEGSFQLKQTARDLLQRLGSRHAQKIGWRDMWAMVVRKRLQSSKGNDHHHFNNKDLVDADGNNSNDNSDNHINRNESLLGETYSKSINVNQWASPVFLQVEIQLQTNDKLDHDSSPEGRCQWSVGSSIPSSFTTDSSTSSLTLINQFFESIFSFKQFRRRSKTVSRPLLSSSSASEDNLIDFYGDTSRTSSSSSANLIFLPDDLETRERRKRFCSLVEGYGSICSCIDPLPLRFVTSFDPMAKISQVPIAIIASNRPHYLYRMLRTLLLTPGCNPQMITIFIDGYYEEPLEVSKLFGLRGIQHTPIAQGNSRITQHYKASLTATFNLYPDAKYAIILEEDLDVSPDFFHYFSQTMHLLDQDESLFCISAWNDQAYEHTSSDTSQLYRVETMPGLGWMLTRKLYKEELEPKWPTSDKQWDWDLWMRSRDIRLGRECIIPDVSRTYHFGSSGLNMNAYFQDMYFKKHAFNTNPSAILQNVDQLRQDNYERLINRLIRMAVILDHQKNLCDLGFLLKLNHSRKKFSSRTSDRFETINQIGNVFLIFIRMHYDGDFNTWLQLAKCLHIWDLDSRGYHRGLWRLNYYSVHLLVIGVPYSPYSVYKPPNVLAITEFSPTSSSSSASSLLSVFSSPKSSLKEIA